MTTSTQDAPPRTFTRRMLGILGTIAIQLLIFLALLEIVARFTNPIGISYYNESARLFDFMILEEPIGYRLPPGLKDNFYGVPVEINALGMRDRPVGEKAPGEHRILAMGDSVIFSVGVALEDSIPLNLERLANVSAPESRNYRVLNMGVPSYNTVQELEQLKQVGQHLEADSAFLFIIPNDIQDKMWVYGKQKNFVIDNARRSYALGLIFYAGRWIVNAIGFNTNPNQNVREDDWEVLPEEELDAAKKSGKHLRGNTVFNREKVLADPGWQNIEQSLVEISRILKAHGVPLLIFYRSNFRTSYAIRIHELADQEGFAAHKLDIWNDPRWEALDKADYVNSPTDSHCNPKGCELYATVIYEGLMKEGMLD